MEAAAKRRKIQEEEQREKDKVKDRMDLIRQMKGVLLAKIDEAVHYHSSILVRPKERL